MFLIKDDSSTLLSSPVYCLVDLTEDERRSLKHHITHFFLHAFFTSFERAPSPASSTSTITMTALIPDYASAFASIVLTHTKPRSIAKFRLGPSFVSFPLTPASERESCRRSLHVCKVICIPLKDAVAQPDVELYVGVAMLHTFRPVNVALKLAIDDTASRRLEKEVAIYEQLGRIPGIPVFYGLYKIGPYTAMILSLVGRPIADFSQLSQSQK